MRPCSSPESSENDPGIEASVVQGRASKVLEQVENGCEEFGINMQLLLVMINTNHDTSWNASVEAI